jgi:hypothetical protein
MQRGRIRLVGPYISNDRGQDLKALTWHGKGDMRCESVPDPKIEQPRDGNAMASTGVTSPGSRRCGPQASSPISPGPADSW